MDIIKMLLKELDQEAQTTSRMLERVPNEQYNYRPHEKSMPIKSLATHIAELPTWIPMTLNTSELDFATSPYQPAEINNTADLIQYFKKCLNEGRGALSQAKEEQLNENWTLRNGSQILSVSSKAEVIRMVYCQTVHHRAQLGVYLRLLNIPIPGSYGPSADEN